MTMYNELTVTDSLYIYIAAETPQCLSLSVAGESLPVLGVPSSLGYMSRA
jgi:hypothetical protein